MKKIISAILAIILSIPMVASNSYMTPSNKEIIEKNISQNIDKFNDISIYKQNLENFNCKYGTQYFIPEDKDVKNIFLSMTLEEFNRYVFFCL